MPLIRPRPSALPLLAVALLFPCFAHAELGGTVSGVQADAARLGSQVAKVMFGGYARHDLTRANGGTVHEFTNANGQVFAVTWSGPGKPDLRTLLGRYFDAFQAASTRNARAMHMLRRPPQVNQPDLQIQSEGHMGWFRGVAFVPSLAPAGFAVADLPQGL